MREQILKAALELMGSEGVGVLSMREVARRAGISHQAPYHYFANREAILAALAEEGFREFNKELEGIRGRNAVSRLIEAGRTYLRFASLHPAQFQLMFRPDLVDLSNHPAALAEASHGFSILQGLVDGLVREKFVPPRFAGGMLMVAWSFVQGLSGLLLQGSLASVGDGEEAMESAFRAFEFLISRSVTRSKERPG